MAYTRDEIDAAFAKFQAAAEHAYVAPVSVTRKRAKADCLYYLGTTKTVCISPQVADVLATGLLRPRIIKIPVFTSLWLPWPSARSTPCCRPSDAAFELPQPPWCTASRPPSARPHALGRSWPDSPWT